MLLKKEDAQTKLCPLLNKLCVVDSCIGWQWQDLGHYGGVANEGFCGMVNITGKEKIQPAMLCY